MSESLLDQLEQKSDSTETQESPIKANTLEDALIEIRTQWSTKIKTITLKLKKFEHLIELQYDVYNLRQDAVDYYYYMLNVLQKQNKEYSRLYKESFISYKTQSSVRYSNESLINNLVEGELSSEKYTIRLLESQVAFMKETIKTIDSIIFGIRNRIDIQKMSVKDIEF